MESHKQFSNVETWDLHVLDFSVQASIEEPEGFSLKFRNDWCPVDHTETC